MEGYSFDFRGPILRLSPGFVTEERAVDATFDLIGEVMARRRRRFAGRGEATEEEDPRLNLMIAEFVEWFAGEYGRVFGGTRCETILGNDPRNRTARCPSLVLGVYDKVNALLVENGFDLAAGRP